MQCKLSRVEHQRNYRCQNRPTLLFLWQMLRVKSQSIPSPMQTLRFKTKNEKLYGDSGSGFLPDRRRTITRKTISTMHRWPVSRCTASACNSPWFTRWQHRSWGKIPSYWLFSSYFLNIHRDSCYLNSSLVNDFVRETNPQYKQSFRSYFIFKDGIRPLWEDENNIAGGTWSLVLPQMDQLSLVETWVTLVSRYWWQDDLLIHSFRFCSWLMTNWNLTWVKWTALVWLFAQTEL